MRCSPLKACLCLSVLIFSRFLVDADVISLKNGEKLEGSITKDTGTTVEIEVKVSNGILDLRTIQKEDILRIEKPDPAVLAYDEIKSIQLPPNSLSVADYDKVIFGRLNPYLTKYPLSANAAAVKKVLAAFTAERDRVKGGELKVAGQWFSAEDVAKNKYQITAGLEFQQIQATAAAGDLIGALNLFSNLEKNYKGARVYPDAVVFVRGLMPSLQREIDAKTQIYNNDMEERKKGLAITPDYRKAELIAAANKEEAQVNALLDDAKKTGVLWTPIYPRNSRSIDELKKTVDTETIRLSGLKVEDMAASIAASDEGRALLQKGDLDDVKAAEARFQDASKLWPDNQATKENPALLAAAKATPAPTPKAAPTPIVAKKAPAPVPAVQTTTVPVVAPEPDKPFFLTMPGILSILVIVAVLGGGISFLARSGKKKDIIA